MKDNINKNFDTKVWKEQQQV